MQSTITTSDCIFRSHYRKDYPQQQSQKMRTQNDNDDHPCRVELRPKQREKWLKQVCKQLIEMEMMDKGDMDTLMQQLIQSSLAWDVSNCIGGKCKMLYQRSPRWKHFFDQILEQNIVLPTEEHLTVNSFFIELVANKVVKG